MANRIRAQRERLGWSQQKLADAVGSTQQQIHKLELGERRLSQQWLARLAAAMGVSSASLLDFPMTSPKARDLPPELVERRLLDFWRRLSPEQQDIALVMIDSWALSLAPRAERA